MSRKLKVFVVEKNKTDAMYLKLSLQKVKQASLTFFSQPENVLEHLAERPDIVICDSIWEENDNLDFIKKIRRISTRTRFIIHASKHNINLIQSFQQAGIYKFIVKTEESYLPLKESLEELAILIPVQEELRRKDA